MKKKFITLLLAALMVLTMVPVTAYADTYTAVTGITNGPTAAAVGVDLELTATVAPETATNKTITWGVKDAGTTGASITGGKLVTTAVGTAVITATIANGKTESTDFAADFTVTVGEFVPATNITGVPTTAYATVPTELPYTVSPDGASVKKVTWSVKTPGETGATINGEGKLLATAAGAATLTATITRGGAAHADYTQDFNITIAAFTPVTNITGVPAAATAGTDLTLTGTVAPETATVKTIVWSVFDKGTTNATIKDGKLSTTAAGTVTVMATIAKGGAAGADYTQKFNITVSKANAPKLATPTGLEWSRSVEGRAQWGSVQNAVGYTVQLYRDGKAYGDAQEVTRTRIDLETLIAKGGRASYSFTVTAKGDGKNYGNSDESRMSASVKFNIQGTNAYGKLNGLDKEYAQNEKISFSVAGTGMDNRRPDRNDTRWLPISWDVTRGINGDFKKDGPYEDSFKIESRGDYTLTVYLREQSYDGRGWNDTGARAQIEKDFSVVRGNSDSKPDSGSSSSSSSSSSDISVGKPVAPQPSTPPTQKPETNPNTGLVLISFIASLFRV